MLGYAFFDSFKGNDHLLLWGDHEDMRALVAFLRKFAKSPKGVCFDELGFHSVVGDVVVMVPNPKASGRVKRVSERLFHWELSQAASDQFADMVNALCSSPGHHYLEPWAVAAGEPTVMVSCGEYPEDLRP